MLRTVLLLICAAALPAAAQDYPNKPIHIIVGYAAGGGNDIIVRVMTPEMTRGLGQPVIVENKPGAQSIIAAETVAKAMKADAGHGAAFRPVRNAEPGTVRR